MRESNPSPERFRKRADVPLRPIQLIANKGMSNAREVHSNLMTSGSTRLDPEQREWLVFHGKGFEELHFARCRKRPGEAPWSNLHLFFIGRSDERAFNDEMIFFRNRLDQGDIGLVNLLLKKLLSQPLPHRTRFRRKEESARPKIETL